MELFVVCEDCQVEHVGRYHCDGCGQMVCIACYVDHNGELPAGSHDLPESQEDGFSEAVWTE